MRRRFADLALFCARQLKRLSDWFTDLAFRVDPTLMGRA